jgi:poly(3-hydroxybutyrate) depolymerase
MLRSRSILCLALPCAALALSSGCAATGDDTPPTGGTGGTGQPPSGGKSGSGGSGGGSGRVGTGGTSGAGGTGGTSGTGASGGTSGTVGSGGTAGMTMSAGGAAGSAGTSGSAGTNSSGAGGAGTAGTGMAGGGGNPGGGRGGRGGGSGGMAGSSTAGAGGAAAGAAGTGGGGTGMSAGCGKAPTIASGMYNNGQHISITAASMQRRYILNVPTNYDNTHPYKLIIAYHELNGNDDEMYKNKYYHLLPLSDNSTIFVAPNGQKNNASCGDASGCGWPNPNNSDLALADAVVAEIEANFCVDTNRIFATGWSYGGSMSYKTACERPLGGAANGFVRAIAVYSGSQLSGNCTPSKPVAYFASHGTHDSVLNYSNGVGLAQNFAKANSCTWATPTQVSSGNHVCTDEMGCAMGYPVKFCSFNGDHTPDPDNGQSGSSWVYQDVWNFFKQF